MPVTYRTHVAPRFSLWIAAGYQRLSLAAPDSKTGQAMQAGRELADKCLSFTYQPDPNVAQVRDWKLAAHVMKELRNYGVTPEQLMLRVAEMMALFEAEPHRCLGQQAENMALGRAVAHMVRWHGPGAGQGKRLLLATAAHVREHLGVWANAFVRKLGSDLHREGELLRQAATFD